MTSHCDIRVAVDSEPLNTPTVRATPVAMIAVIKVGAASRRHGSVTRVFGSDNTALCATREFRVLIRPGPIEYEGTIHPFMMGGIVVKKA
jgi:hypothetical protein